MHLTRRTSTRRAGAGAIVLMAAAALVVVPGSVASADTLPTGAQSLESVNQPGRYVRHLSSTGQITPVTAGSDSQTKRDATFTVVNGLASPACYSFQTKSGVFLRHRGYRLRVEAVELMVARLTEGRRRPAQRVLLTPELMIRGSSIREPAR